MSGVSKITIAESAESLKSLMKKQKTALSYAKLQALYLIKIQATETIRYLAVIVKVFKGFRLLHTPTLIYPGENLYKEFFSYNPSVR